MRQGWEGRKKLGQALDSKMALLWAPLVMVGGLSSVDIEKKEDCNCSRWKGGQMVAMKGEAAENAKNS